MHSIVQETTTSPLELLRQQWAREAAEKRAEARDRAKRERKYAAELALLSRMVPRSDYAAEFELLIPPAPPKPPPPEYRYGLTQQDRRTLARMRAGSPQLARELHVWGVVIAAPYTTTKALAEACASDSDLSARTWPRIIGAMLAAGQVHLGPRGFEHGPNSIEADSRPQTSKSATRRLIDRLGDDTGPRDPGERAKRVRRVLRNGQRAGCYYSSDRSLAAACAKNGSGTAAGYRRVVERMLATAELTRIFDGSICLADH